MNWDLFFDIIAWGAALPSTVVLVMLVVKGEVEYNEENFAVCFVGALVCWAYIAASWGI